MSFLEFIQVPTNFFTLTIALVSGVMLIWPGLRPAGRRVGPHQAIQLINHEEALIIDLREAGEFATSHLPEARNIPFKELDSRMSELEPLKDKNLLLVCASGARSEQAAARLAKQGFARLSSLEGGVDAWQRTGLPLIRSRKK